MGMVDIEYVKSNRGIIKIVEIVLGFVISYLLCGTWVGESGCYGSGRLGYCTMVNSLAIGLNIIWLILNLLEFRFYKLERFYNIFLAFLFLLAVLLIVWFVTDHWNSWTVIVGAVLIIAQFIFLLWDVKIIQGEAPN